ncbi:MAG: FGGY-family carbohydrate kinase [Candidatus Hermodarchaeota archaeon]
MTNREEEKYILAYDHGTSGVKTAICTVSGKILDFVFEKTPLYLKKNGGAEQNPDEWWEAVLKTSKCLIDKEIVDVDDIVAICCSSQWSGTVAVDSDGSHLGNAIIWMDSRGAPYINKLMGGLLKISGYGITNILKFIYKTGGGPTLSGKDPIAHILYLKNEVPEIYNKTHKFLECKDFLNLKFTGKFAASYDSIMLYWVTNTRNPQKIRYDNSLIKKLGVKKSQMPKLKRSIDVLGTVSREVADEIGINRVKVIVGSPDIQSAVIGSGAIEDYQGHIYLGTSSWVMCHVPFKKTDIFHNIASLPSAIPGKYIVANEQESAGGCLTFLRDNIFYDDREDYYGNPEVYKLFDSVVENVPVGSNGLIFTPWLYGERTPIEDHTIRSILFNMSLTTKKEDIIRAAFEGVAYNSRWVLKYVERFIKRDINPMNIIGGGAQSDIWCQIYADVLNRTIRQVKDPIQANARGAAFIASVALGYITFKEIPNLIEFSGIFKPIQTHTEIYNKIFKEFLLLYKNNKAAYQRLNRGRR